MEYGGIKWYRKNEVSGVSSRGPYLIMSTNYWLLCQAVAVLHQICMECQIPNPLGTACIKHTNNLCWILVKHSSPGAHISSNSAKQTFFQNQYRFKLMRRVNRKGKEFLWRFFVSHASSQLKFLTRSPSTRIQTPDIREDLRISLSSRSILIPMQGWLLVGRYPTATEPETGGHYYFNHHDLLLFPTRPGGLPLRELFSFFSVPTGMCIHFDCFKRGQKNSAEYTTMGGIKYLGTV